MMIRFPRFRWKSTAKLVEILVTENFSRLQPCEPAMLLDIWSTCCCVNPGSALHSLSYTFAYRHISPQLTFSQDTNTSEELDHLRLDSRVNSRRDAIHADIVGLVMDLSEDACGYG